MRLLLRTTIVIFISTLVAQANQGVHLIMLTGDDRMEKLDETASFVPLLENGLSGDEVVVVKAASQRAHLGHWHSDWVGEFRGQEVRDSAQGWILHDLIQKARSATEGKKVQSLTLVWAQGVQDALGGYSEPYDESFRAITSQLKQELGRDDLNGVIARLAISDRPERYPDLNAIRKIQENLGHSLPRACWVDTDSAVLRSRDYSKVFGELLADAALKQIGENASSEATALPARKAPNEQPPAHLFLLSGQSNMANLNPEEAFVPAVVEAFGESGAVVVKAAYGAKSISHWVDWKRNENQPKDDLRNWLYLELIGKTKFAIGNREIKTVTFCWMQGEADSSAESSVTVYAENFETLLQMLREDLDREDINFVIGRLSDHSEPEKFPAWEQMRQVQVKLADGSPRGRWIDTDAWNGDDDNIHYPSGENGRVALGKAFASQAIELVRSTEN